MIHLMIYSFIHLFPAPSFEAATGKYDKSIEAGQPPAHNPEWNNSLNSSNAPSAPSF